MLFEIHTHSTFSDGKASPKEMIEWAKKTLNGIAITDHDEINGSLLALEYATEDFTVIPGVEVSAKEGHILALYVHELIPRDLPASETVDKIHSLGGLAIAAHPYDSWRSGVGDLILKLPFDAVEVVNGHTFRNISDPTKVCIEAGLPMVGGSDAHTLGEIGSVITEFEGDFTKAVKSQNVKIRSDSVPKLLLKHGVGLIKRKLF